MGPVEQKRDIMWENVKINDNDYLISVTHKDDMIKVLLTDLIELWTETLTNEIILQKCRKLNPLLNVEALDYNEIVLNVLKNVSNYIVEASVAQIKLRVPMEGALMKFDLSLTKSTPQDFWETITKPLCISGMEFIRQRTILLDLIKKKDEEIAEYKAQGAELLRKNIETKFFEDEHLKEGILNPDTVNCKNAFRGILDFHDEFNSRKPSSVASTDETDKTGARVITPGVAENASERGNTESKKVDNKERSRAEVKKKVAKSKTGTANLKYKPPKKLKKELEHLPEVLPRRETNRVKRKRCRQCSANGLRKETNYFCPGCKDNPGLCIGKCFKEYHKLITTVQ